MVPWFDGEKYTSKNNTTISGCLHYNSKKSFFILLYARKGGVSTCSSPPHYTSLASIGDLEHDSQAIKRRARLAHPFEDFHSTRFLESFRMMYFIDTFDLQSDGRSHL